ncbi:MAG: SipW-dependent-type signal peptide-containing protein [Eubacteriales bacterium]|nr:SipW-dependent-type signal peptide-containing protein [Eubacteriales bacterium]
MKSTKKSLLLSMLSLVLCFVMLIGTTFAWFTDSVTSGVNKIQAGNLDVALEMSTDNGTTWTNAEGQVLNFVKAASAPENEQILWEPGCTYMLPQLRVVNKGNLALKYQFAINGVDGNAKLLEAIEWTVKVGGNEVALDKLSGNLLANTNSENIVISGHMKEEAGNEYQGLSIEGIGITIFATQMTSEYDSFGNTYDEGAMIESFEELKAAAQNGGVLVLKGNIAATENITFAKNVKLVGDGDTRITGKPLYFKGDSVEISGINFNNGTVGSESCMYFTEEGLKNLVIENCTFSNAKWDAIQLTKAAESVTIKNNSFKNTAKGYRYIHLEIRDANDSYGTTNAILNITGNTFTNLTAAYCEDSAITIAGFKMNNITFKDNTFAGVGADTINTDMVWICNGTTFSELMSVGTIKANNHFAVEATPTTLSTAISNASNGDTVVLSASTTDYTIPTYSNKELTIVGSGEDTVVSMPASATTLSGSKLNLENVTVKSQHSGQMPYTQAIQHANGQSYKNVVFDGLFVIQNGATFENCTFKASTTDEYTLWLYSGNMVLKNCVFEGSGTKGFVKLYGESGNAINADLENCVFNGSCAKNAAIYVSNNNNNANNVVYSVNAKNCMTTCTNLVMDSGKTSTITIS